MYCVIASEVCKLRVHILYPEFVPLQDLQKQTCNTANTICVYIYRRFKRRGFFFFYTVRLTNVTVFDIDILETEFRKKKEKKKSMEIYNYAVISARVKHIGRRIE